MKSILITTFLLLLSSTLYAQTAEEAQALHDKGRECFNAVNSACRGGRIEISNSMSHLL